MAMLLAGGLAQAEGAPGVRPVADLRSAIRQMQAGGAGMAAPPRQLSAAERAELRRQLSQQARKP